MHKSSWSLAWLLVLAGCSAPEGVNPAQRCDAEHACKEGLVCYRKFCIPGDAVAPAPEGGPNLPDASTDGGAVVAPPPDADGAPAFDASVEDANVATGNPGDAGSSSAPDAGMSTDDGAVPDEDAGSQVSDAGPSQGDRELAQCLLVCAAADRLCNGASREVAQSADESRAQWEAAMRRALDAFVRGDDARAREAYLEATRLDPRAPASQRGLALAAARLGDKAEARAALARYLKLAPNAPDAQSIAARIGVEVKVPAASLAD